jgi:outer membrane beta-barrel protein
MLRYTLLWFLVLGSLVHPLRALAQLSDNGEDRDLDQIEAEIKKHEIRPTTPTNTVDKDNAKETTIEDAKVENLSDLSKLQPFSEVSVMQRRYMPKSGRFQLYGGLSDMVNDPWNTTTGLNLRAAYGFTETWGLEFSGYFLGSNPSQAAQALLSQQNVSAQSFGTSTGNFGAYIMWTPIYGKMSFTTKKIVPFDMYFTLGAATTSLTAPAPVAGTAAVPASASGVSAGFGQIYSITRSVGFRWDLTWNSYTLPSGGVNNLLLTFGANWYFPEVNYR